MAEKGETPMPSHGTLSNGNGFPGWYVQFQIDVLSQLPRPGELSEDVADGWHNNRGAMKKALRDALVPPSEVESEPKQLPMSITLNTDATPFVPSNMSLQGEGTEHCGMGVVTLENSEDGQLYANGVKVELYISSNQKGGDDSIRGYELAKELKDEPTLNARILDALYENQWLIPDDWGYDGPVYFWATKFRDKAKRICIGYIFRRADGTWYRCHDSVGFRFARHASAARLAKR
jgi:hypothetical protein